MLKRINILILLISFSHHSFAQTAGKIGNVDYSSITKIGTFPVSSINTAGSVSLQSYSENCKEIKLNNPEATDGVYTIDPDGPGTIEPFNCFCDMTTDGGGWTMVGYYKDPADYDDYIHARSDAFFGTEIADPNSSTAWTDWRVLAGVTWPIQFAVVLDQATFASWGSLNAKTIYRVKNREIMPNYGTSQDLVTGDNLYYKWSFAEGYTDVNPSSASSDVHWYPLHSSGTYLICFHNTSGYTAYYGQGVPGGDNTWHHSARLFVR